MNEIIHLVIPLAGLLVFSAFFSASETAFSAVNRIKLKNLANRGSKRARLVLQMVENYDKLLSTVLIGNNIVNICSSALGTVLFVGLFGNAGVSIATIVMTVLVLFFGEISPKTLAKEAPEKTAMAFAFPLRFFMVLLGPANKLAGFWRRFIVSVFNVKGDHSITEDELLTFVGEAAQEGGINEGEEKMIRQVIEFDEITAREICTPRVDITAVSTENSTAEIEKLFAASGFSRLPVYDGNIDNIVGVLLLKDFYFEAVRRGAVPAKIVKNVVYVSEGIKINRLLHTLQRKLCHLAVLVDEFGCTVGIVTIEDIMEELVGEIWDEHDEVIENIKSLGAGSWRVLGNTGLDEFFGFFSLEHDRAGKSRSVTVANWVLENLGGVPRRGDGFVYANFQIQVFRMRRRRVMELTVRRAVPEMV